MAEKTKSLEMTARKTPEASPPSPKPTPFVSPSGFDPAAIQGAVGNMATQRAAREVGGEDAPVRSESALNFLSVEKVGAAPTSPPPGGSQRQVVGGPNEAPLPADTDVAGAVERGLSEVDSDHRPYEGEGAATRRPALTDLDAAVRGPTSPAQNVRADAATAGQISISLPHPAAVDRARARMRDGTGVPADALTIIHQAVGVARSYFSGQVGGPQNLSGDRLAGYCAMARDITALSLATQIEGSGVPATIRRYSVNGVAGRTTGQSHQFAIVEFHFGDRTEQFIIDPTYAQFVDPGGGFRRGGEADRARAGTGSAEAMTRLLEDGYIPLSATTARIYLDSLVPPGRDPINPGRLLSGAGGIDAQGRGPSTHLEAGGGAPALSRQLEQLPYVEIGSAELKRAADQLRAMGRNDLAHEVDQLSAALLTHGIDNPRPFTGEDFENAAQQPRPTPAGSAEPPRPAQSDQLPQAGGPQPSPRPATVEPPTGGAEPGDLGEEATEQPRATGAKPPRGGGPPAPSKSSHVELDPNRERPTPTDTAAEDLGIEPKSRLDTDVGRANRKEQKRRAAEYSIDQLSMQGGRQPGGKVAEAPRPDATARARAADYAQLYARWAEGPDSRRELITDVINAHLAREGIPPVKVVFGGKSPGSAEFAPDSWTMALSAKSLDSPAISIDHFSTLVENAVHETQHAVTNFRGIRLALADRKFNSAVFLLDPIVEQAKAANARQDPNKEFDEHARNEAREIYAVSIEPRRAMGENVPEGGVNRSEVMGRHDDATRALDQAKAEHRSKQRELDADPADPVLQRELRVTAANLKDAEREFVAAHNAYMALPEETYSWRAGSSVKVAMAERLALEADLANAMERANVAAAEQGRLLARRDADGAAAALARRQEALEHASGIQHKIDGLTTDEPRKVGGRVIRREVPLSGKEVAEAPRAPVKGYTDDDFGPGPRSGKPAPSAKSSVTESTLPPPSPPSVVRPSPDQPVVPATESGAALPKAAATVAPGPQTPVGIRREVNVSPTGDATTEWVRERQTPTGTRQTGVAVTAGPSELSVGARSTAIPTAGGATRQTYGKAQITAQGVGGEVGNLKTSPTGTTRGAVGGVKLDEHGNPTFEVGYLIQGNSGSSIKPTFSQGRRVDAEEPVALPDGGFLVNYSITDTTTLGIGGEGKRSQAGIGVGGSYSKFSADAASGSKRFSTKPEAEAFRNNAALMLQFDQGAQEVPTSSDDVKQIAVGEKRGSAQTAGTATSVSVSWSGASLGRNSTESTTHGLTVERLPENVVNVTTNVTKEKAKEWAASGLFLTNAKGKSTSHGFSVILQFDLSTKPGKTGFDFYMGTGIPAMGGWKNIGETTIDTQATYDRYSIPLLGTAAWTEPQWESTTVGEGGRGREIGGGQEHMQDPTWLARKTGDRKLFSSAQLVYRETDEKLTYTAVIRVKSESADYNVEQFGKAFYGARAGANVTPSGEWVISAEISKAIVDDLANLRDRMGRARSSADKARLMTGLMTERGAQMAGGLMHSGAKKSDWMVELKGDPNFPGAAGKERLDTERRTLSESLKTDPTTADAVAHRAQEVLAELAKRREAVADKSRYTDLPQELRDQQLALLDQHRDQYSALRQTAIMGAMKAKPGEKIGEIQARTTRKDWHKDLKGDERDYAKLQDVVAIKEEERKELDKDVRKFSIALGDVWQPDGSFAARLGISLSTVGTRLQETKEHYQSAMAMDQRAAEVGPRLLRLREAWLAIAQSEDVKAKLDALRAFDKALDEHIELRRLCIKFIKEAAKTIYPIVTEKSRSGNSAFWNSLGVTDEDVERATYRPVPMALSK